ncbi:hypothetical protein ZIOFF_069857 [Zingiber officinale]|uniref:Uncharacterized protein n=1 Tax=Zingiber officinale TaxID=94328 RepID=A0A8J5C4Q8_ZINOF|nr:hypothetical protein ZIOFF_069857 [Zingiber officinale]
MPSDGADRLRCHSRHRWKRATPIALGKVRNVPTLLFDAGHLSPSSRDTAGYRSLPPASPLPLPSTGLRLVSRALAEQHHRQRSPFPLCCQSRLTFTPVIVDRARKGDLFAAKNYFMLALSKDPNKRILYQLSMLERKMAQGKHLHFSGS